MNMDGGTTMNMDGGTTMNMDGGTAQTCRRCILGGVRVTDGNGQFIDYASAALPDTGNMSDADTLFLLFNGSALGASFDGEATGSFNLSMSGDDNSATCSRCVQLTQDPATPGKSFFAKSGTLDIDPASEQLSGRLNATLTDVTLVEVTIDPVTNISTPVTGGACVHLASANVVYTTPVGWTCPVAQYDDGVCDCGCGVADLDCTDASADVCQTCNAPGSCGNGGAPLGTSTPATTRPA